MGDANDKIGMMTGEHASVVEQELDAVLQENVLMLNAIGDLFTNRQNAIVALQTTRGTHQGKLKQYETVKGVRARPSAVLLPMCTGTGSPANPPAACG